MNKSINMRHSLSCFASGVNPLKVKLLDKYLVPGNCCDIGCGNGLYGKIILKRCSGLLQIDVVDRRFPEARQYPFQRCNANNLGALKGRFENIVAFDIMEHLEDDVAFLKHLII